jgi:putative ABC transport system permease protein
MLRNYIKVAVRNILKHRAFSFINIFGLAVAMTICMAIMMLVADQMMNDRHNPNRNRIYRVNTIPFFEGKTELRGNETATTTLPVRDELLNSYTGVEKAVRLVRGFGNNWMELEPGYDINIPVSGYFADPEVLEVFHHELVYGDPNTALTEPYSVVLTKRAAEKLFDIENPVGEILKVGDKGTYKVTGVLKETSNKSHIVSEAFASISTLNSLAEAGSEEKKKYLESWNNYTQGWVYILLEEGTQPEEIQAHLDKIHTAHFSELPTPESVGAFYTLQNLMKISPGPMINNPIGPFMPWIIIYFLSALAGIVLITSCFNFTNLSIARSLSRAREIGVRKVTGAMRIQIFNQFISESVVIALFALVLAWALLVVLKPFALDLTFVRALRWDFSTNYFVYILFFLFAIVVGIVAGFFPAGVLSGFQPVKVLKNLNNTRLMSRIGMRKALLVVQFTFSMIFILTVIVLYNQLNLFLHSDYGFNPSDKIVIQKGSGDFQTLKNELLKEGNILNVSAASHLPSAGVVYGDGFKKSLDDKEWTSINYFAVDQDYLRNMDIPLVAGKFFSDEANVLNSNTIVLNEAAIQAFHFASPLDALGEVIYFQADSTEKRIIGVVKDYTHEMAAERLRPLALMYSPDQYRILQIRYAGNFQDASRDVEKVWTTVYPGMKVEVKDFEKQMGELYEILFGTLVKVLGFVTVLAIVISCLGLLGMATYTIQSRKKEIALRKVLGSSNQSLVLTLSTGYLSILIVAVMIAVPAAYYINSLWLERFAVHVTVDWITISIGTLILGVFGLLTIASQTVQAAFINPVENLKSE